MPGAAVSVSGAFHTKFNQITLAKFNQITLIQKRLLLTNNNCINTAMDATDKQLAELTDDEYELDVLTPDRAAFVEPDDPMYVEIAQLSHQLSHYKQKLPHAQRKALNYALQPHPSTKVAELAGVAYATAIALRKNPHFHMIANLQERIDRLNRGPDLTQRMAMMWRIAKREEMGKPSIALKALDLMNKQQGLYQNDDDNTDKAPNITVMTFNFGMDGKPLEDLRDVTPVATVENIDRNAPFKPLTIDVPSNNDLENDQ